MGWRSQCGIAGCDTPGGPCRSLPPAQTSIWQLVMWIWRALNCRTSQSDRDAAPSGAKTPEWQQLEVADSCSNLDADYLNQEQIFIYNQCSAAEPDSALSLDSCPISRPTVCFGSWAQPDASAVGVWRGPACPESDSHGRAVHAGFSGGSWSRRGTSGQRPRVAPHCAGTSVRAGACRCTT